MKKFFKSAMFIAAAAMAFASCSKDAPGEFDVNTPSDGNLIELTISTAKPEAVNTRTMVGEDGITPYWLPKDVVGVSAVDAQNKAQFINTSSEISETTTFSGTWNMDNGTEIFAYYPYSSTINQTAGYGAKVELPAEQKPTLTSFDPLADLLVSEQFTISADFKAIENLAFTRAGAFLKIALVDKTDKNILSEEAVNSLSVKADEYLAGRVYLHPEDGTAELYKSGKESYAVTATYEKEKYNIGNGVTYLGVLPQTLTSGSTLTFEADTDNYIIKREIKLGSDVEILVGKITTLNVSVADVHVTHKSTIEPEPEPTESIFESDEIFVCTANTSSNPGGLGNTTFNNQKATGFKIGASKNPGTFTSEAVDVSGDYILSLYGVAWKDSYNNTLTVTIEGDGSIIGDNIRTLKANEGASGTGNYTINNVTDSDYYTFQLINLTPKSKISFTAQSGKQVVVAGVHLTATGTSEPKPVINVKNPTIEVDYEDSSIGTIEYTISNPVEGASIKAATTAEWIEADLFDYDIDNEISFMVYENDGDEREATITLSYEGAKDVIVTVKQAKHPDHVAGVKEYVDLLNQTWTGISEQTYTSKTLSAPQSEAMYSVQCAGDKSSIQLRSSGNNSGVVTTTSGGKVTKIRVKWNTETLDARVLNVYCSNTAYKSPADLYASGISPIKTFNKANGDAEYVIEGEYSHIGFRSNSGALYLDEVEITWEK